MDLIKKFETHTLLISIFWSVMEAKQKHHRHLNGFEMYKRKKKLENETSETCYFGTLAETTINIITAIVWSISSSRVLKK